MECVFTRSVDIFWHCAKNNCAKIQVMKEIGSVVKSDTPCKDEDAW